MCRIRPVLSCSTTIFSHFDLFALLIPARARRNSTASIVFFFLCRPLFGSRFLFPSLRCLVSGLGVRRDVLVSHEPIWQHSDRSGGTKKTANIYKRLRLCGAKCFQRRARVCECLCFGFRFRFHRILSSPARFGAF